MNSYHNSTTVSFNPFRDGELVTSVPTTASQREIWASIEMDPIANRCYNESIRIALKGKLDFPALERAFNETIASRDALRATFSPRGKDFMVGVHIPRKIDFMDCTGNFDHEETIEAHARTCTEYEFDLSSGPVFKAEVLKVSEQEHYMFLTGHHLVCDGWSMALIVSDISNYYKLLTKKGAIPLKVDVPRFYEYALEKSTQDQEIPKYWLDEFRDLPSELNLPLDFNRPSIRTYDSIRIDYHISPETIIDARSYAARNKKSIYQLLLANFAFLLNDLTKQEEIVVGISSAAQANNGHENLVGHLVNLLPIKFNFKHDMPFSLLFEQAKNKMLDAFDHQNTTFGEILKHLKIPRDPSKIPLVNVIFNVDQQYPGQGMEFGELSAQYVSNPRNFENFEIFINATLLGDICTLECQYNSNLFKEETIKAWLKTYETNLKQIISGTNLKASVEKTPSGKKEAIKPAPSPDENELSIARDIWQEVLKIKDIPANANFFAIGGHSLLGVDVCHLAKEKYGVNVKLKDLLCAPTLAEFSTYFFNCSRINPIETPVEKKSRYPLSCAQKQTLFWEKLNPNNSGVYHLPSAIRISCSVEKDRLENAFLTVIEAHPSLRSVINKNNEQEILAIQDLNFSIEEINATYESARDQMNEFARVSFDLEAGPLFSVKLFKLGENDYIIFAMFHHIIFDGWSFDIFFRDLDLAYSNMALPEEEMGYLDFSSWQAGYLKSNQYQLELEAWKNKLSGELPKLNLPTDKIRTATINTEADEVKFEFSPDLVEKISLFVKAYGVSTYSLLMSCYTQALMDYSRMDRVIVGMPVRGRNNSKFLNTIGYFVNGSVVCGERKEAPIDTINAIRKEVAWGLSHQEVPFSEISRNINQTNTAGFNPIYQAFFSFQDISGRSQKFNGSLYKQVNVDCVHASVDINMWVKASPDKIEGSMAYRKDLFFKETMDRFYEYFLDLVEFAIDDPDKAWHECKPKSLMNFYNSFNNTYKLNTTEDFVELIDRNSLRYPGKVAIISGDKKITYQELKTYSDSIAQELIELGLESGDLVGLGCDRDVNAPIFLLGILKAGCGYVPLDPTFPDDRLDYIAKNSGVKLIVSSVERELKFKQFCDTHKNFNDFNLSKKFTGVKKSENSSVAYVIYTSGSTGLPKGVQISRAALNNFLCSMSKKPGMNSNDTFLAVTTFSFDISALELYLPLLVGGELIIASKAETMDAEDLIHLVQKYNVNVMQATPTTWRMMLSCGWTGGKDFKVLCGGEAFPVDLAKQLASVSSQVWNMYGPTETTIWSSCERVKYVDDYVSIGRPIDNTSMYILDENMLPVPYGVAGDLYIAGEGLALGYHKQPELTKQSFVPNSMTLKGRMYRTGDIARFNNKGDLVCIGRSDGQIKLRGYRIELGEIETAIAKQTNINEAVVVVKNKDTANPVLAAFVRVHNKSGFNQFKIQEQLVKNLPSYMIPSQFYVVDSYPQTLNCKIDRKALESLEVSENTQSEEQNVHTNSSLEVVESVKEIWMRTLEVESCKFQDSFFDVGGHSLLAVDLFRELETKLKVNLPLSILIEDPTLGGIIKHISPNINFEEDVEQIKGSSNEDRELFVPNICKSIVPIKRSGTKAPIFVFHSVGGNVLNYMRLGSVDSGHPIIGVQAKGVDGVALPSNSLHDMAKAYAEEILLVRGDGPYILAGGSFGGFLALEVGRILRDLGMEVRPIIMFDTFGPGLDLKGARGFDSSILGKIKMGLGWRVKRYLIRAQCRALSYIGLPIPHGIRHQNIEFNNYEALWTCELKDYDGDIVLLRAPIDKTVWYREPEMGWKNHINGKINLHYVNGIHSKFIESEDFLKVLENALRDF